MVIPAIAEYENIKRLLISLNENLIHSLKNTLILFVINNVATSSEEVKSENLQTIKYLRWIMKENVFNLNLALIDCASEGKTLDSKTGGVGLARKIGMDSALKFLASTGLLICLDADCVVSKDYLQNIFIHFEKNNPAAAVVRYEHTFVDLKTEDAIICYEIFLRYYLLGLKFARSPFAHHTIGSTMICTAETYVAIGGMNKRKAAEDFYFIEKLAKDFKIAYIDDAIVYPSSRGSWRVPFGTGQRVNRFLSHERNEYLLYSPKNFITLKNWLEIFYEWNGRNAELIIEKADAISKELKNFLEQNNFMHTWEKISASTNNPEQINKQKNYWFDGFKTLKLIHHLRDTEDAPSPMFTALNDLFSLMKVAFDFKWEEEIIPPLELQKKYLLLLRKLT